MNERVEEVGEGEDGAHSHNCPAVEGLRQAGEVVRVQVPYASPERHHRKHHQKLENSIY